MTHILRDVIYGYIELESEELELIDAPVVQRLRRIRQLARADLVYPSLVHTRFEHSLGVMHVASQMAEKVNIKPSSPEYKAVRAAALLHDIGHGPYSHVFESASGIKHEIITQKIIKEDEDLCSRLKRLGVSPEEVLNVLESESLAHDIISSQLDADRIDYLTRDSYHAGVKYGVFDFHRLIHTLCIGEDSKRKYLCVMEKGKEAAVGFTLARASMHTQVYYHHVRIITDNMILRAIECAKEAGALPKELFDIDSSNFLSEYLALDDEALSMEIISKGDDFSRSLFQGLKTRKLYKRALKVNVKEFGALQRKRIEELGNDRSKRKELERRIAEGAGINPDFVIIHIQTEKNPLCPYSQDSDDILIRMETGEPKTLSEVVPLQSSQPLKMELYVLAPDQHKEKVKNSADELIKRY